MRITLQVGSKSVSRNPGAASRIQPWILLLLGIFVLITVLETGVRVGIGRLSRIEGRIESERRAVLALRDRPDAARTVLVLGNSLFLEGVDFPSLQNALAPDFKATRYVVEQTSYTDWYYGLRAIYAAGVRPGVVVLSLNATSMTDNLIRGDYFAYRMMRMSDFWEASRAAGLSPTGTFSLLLGSISGYYGTRSETRKVALARLVPAVTRLTKYMTPESSAPPFDRNRVVAIAAGRLRILDAMVRAQGGRFVLVVPASLDANDVPCLIEAGEQAGVPVLAPLTGGSLSAGDFRDGFHLNSVGAARYTQALRPMLRQTVATLLR